MNPVYDSVNSLFEYKPCYFIPKYQRAYAWGEVQVMDFIDDIETSFQRRYEGRAKQHFFGGVISVMSQYPGTHNVNQYEVIDGQQRLSTFNLFANAILSNYKILKQKSDNLGFDDLSRRCETQISDLGPRFLQFDQLIGEEATTVKTFRMSKRDNDFYSDLIRDNNPDPTIESHFKLKFAFDEINKVVIKLLDNVDDLDETSNRLGVFEQMLSTDFKILHLVTTNRRDAYQLFQVINDRGTSLTDADLLRCKVLELMEGNTEQQDEAEAIWDGIVTHKDTENHLVWVYESTLGSRPKAGAIYDYYMKNYFELGNVENINIVQLQMLLNKNRELKSGINKVRDLLACEWPYEDQNPVEAWDRDRLVVLIDYLRNVAAIPLLLSATKLDHQKFSKIVQMLERFFYRYKVMCNGHNTSLKNAYAEHAVLINNSPDDYDIELLRTRLNGLLLEKAPTVTFEAAIDELLYRQSGSKRDIKYLLLMIDQYARWFDDGAAGIPMCIDKSRLLDRRQGTTIEHIYSKSLNPEDEQFNAGLEAVKNNVHNLTILSSTENSLAGTESFEEKKIVFGKSSSYHTRKI